MKVTDPSGQTWRVSRRWVPWRRKVDSNSADFVTDVPLDGGDDPISAIAFALVFIVVAPFVVLALLFAAELLLLLLLLPFAILGRMMLGRHWHVEVRRDWTPWWEVEAGDWQASTLKIHEIADQVRRGEIPARTLNIPSGPPAVPGGRDTP